MILDLTSWRRYDAVLSMLSGAQATIGRRTPHQFRHYGYDVVVDHQRDHEIDNDRRLLAALGVSSTSAPHLELPKGATSPLPTPYVVFHLWPGGANFAGAVVADRVVAHARAGDERARVRGRAHGRARRRAGEPRARRPVGGRRHPRAQRRRHRLARQPRLARLRVRCDQREHRRDARGRGARARRRSRSTVRRAACAGGRSVRTRAASRHRWCPTATWTSGSSTTSATPTACGRSPSTWSSRRGTTSAPRRSRPVGPERPSPPMDGGTGSSAMDDREPGSLCIATVASIGSTPRGDPTRCIGGPRPFLRPILDVSWISPSGRGMHRPTGQRRTRWRRCSTRLP